MSRARARVETDLLQTGAEVRREGGGRVLPAGPKARRTRGALLSAATELFAKQGFQATTVAQIAEQAGVSLGTFYQYFRHRGEVLTAMLTDSLRVMSRRTETRWRAEEGRPGLERIIANYLRSYLDGGEAVGVWESVSHTEPGVAEVRRGIAGSIRDAISEELLRSGRRGGSRPMNEREAELSALALTGMIDRFCFYAYIFDPPERPPSPQEAARILAAIWAEGIGLAQPAPTEVP